MKRYVVRRGDHGFTLIELLVCIALVSVLSALLFPIFARIREKGRQATCLSNIGQLGKATSLYAQDYDEVFPWGGDPSDIFIDSWRGTPWASVAPTMPLICATLHPYTPDSRVWECPDDTGYDRVGSFEDFPLPTQPTAYDKYGMSYAYHSALALEQQSVASLTAYDTTAPYTERGATEILLFTDMNGSWHGGAAWPDKRYIAVFCDGHAKLITRDYDSQLWHQSFSRPGGS